MFTKTSNNQFSKNNLDFFAIVKCYLYLHFEQEAHLYMYVFTKRPRARGCVCL